MSVMFCLSTVPLNNSNMQFAQDRIEQINVDRCDQCINGISGKYFINYVWNHSRICMFDCKHSAVIYCIQDTVQVCTVHDMHDG